MESISAPVERMCAVLERPNGLVFELKRSYKSLEANRKGAEKDHDEEIRTKNIESDI